MVQRDVSRFAKLRVRSRNEEPEQRNEDRNFHSEEMAGEGCVH